jgi:hypothetical protein
MILTGMTVPYLRPKRWPMVVEHTPKFDFGAKTDIQPDRLGTAFCPIRAGKGAARHHVVCS